MKADSGKYFITSLRIPAVLLIILVVSFAARLIYWWFLVQRPYDLSGDAVIYYNAAHSIAESWSYLKEGILTASKPPAYPIFAGLILKVFGDDNAVIILQYLFGVLASLPIYLIARNYIDENKASLVTLAYLIYPTTWFWESCFMSESLYLWLNNLFLFFMHRYIMKKSNSDLAAGAFWGAASFLTRPAAVFPLSIVFLSLIYQNSLKRVSKITAIWCCIFLFVLSPWIIRNYIVFGQFIPASNSAGVTIYTSYVSWGYDMSIVNLLPEDRVSFARLANETEKNKYLIRRTFDYLKKNPLKFFSVIPTKLKDFLHPFNGRWYPLSMGSKFNPFYGLLASFAVLGFWLNRKADIELIKLSVPFLIGAVIAVIIFHGEIRYRFPLTPIFCMLASLCFVERLSFSKKKIVAAIILSNFIFWGIGMKIP